MTPPARPITEADIKRQLDGQFRTFNLQFDLLTVSVPADFIPTYHDPDMSVLGVRRERKKALPEDHPKARPTRRAKRRFGGNVEVG